jgi:hypothetical protein
LGIIFLAISSIFTCCESGWLGFVQVLRGKKNEDRTSNIAHSKLARSHLYTPCFFSFTVSSVPGTKKAKLNIGYRITSLSQQEEKSRTSPHIDPRRRCLCIAISVIAATACCPPHAPRPSARRPPPAAHYPPHAEPHVAVAVPHIGPFAITLTSSSIARTRWAVGAASTPR